MKVIINRTNKKVLKICPQADGSVTVVAYRFLSQKHIANHIADNMQWISSCLQKLSKSPRTGVERIPEVITQRCDPIDNQTLKDIFAGKSLLLCGQLYHCCSASNAQTHLKGDCLYICEKQYSSRELRLKAINSFLKRMSSSTLSQQVSKLGSEMALCPTKIQFKDLRGRWGSCADAEMRAIVLDYRLIQLPQRLQNYVIAHAFAHFKWQGHTDELFNYLSTFQPNYKDCQKDIENYNFLLDI